MSNGARFALGVSLHTLDRDQSLETIGLLQGSSVRAVELWASTFARGDRHVREARHALAVAGVRPRTVHADFGPSLDISSPDAVPRSAGIEAIAVALDLAVRVGADIVVAHPSSAPIEREARGSRMDQARRSIESLAEQAQEAGCRLALELLPRSCLGNSADELLFLLQGVDPAAAGVCLDVNHLMDRFASLPEVVIRLAPRLIALHCSDYDGVDEKHWPPLQGVLDWAAFLSALSNIGFAGPLHYEADLHGETPAERLAFLEANYSQLMALLP
jgi:hexosaminidase